jgi:hypothetical protein
MLFLVLGNHFYFAILLLENNFYKKSYILINQNLAVFIKVPSSDENYQVMKPASQFIFSLACLPQAFKSELLTQPEL